MTVYTYGEHRLTAKTDAGARRQARKIDKQEGREISDRIEWWRSEDQCSWYIDK